MRIITGIVLFTWCLLFDVSSLFAQENWQQGETRFWEIEGREITVKFLEVTEEKECFAAMAFSESINEFKVYLYFVKEGKLDSDDVICGGKQRKIFVGCDKGQLTFLIDNIMFNSNEEALEKEVVSRE